MRKLLIYLLLLTSLCCLSGCAEDKGYEEIKAEAISFLEQNQAELEKIAIATIENSEVPESAIIEGVTYVTYDDGNGYVIFALDAQGMLGGQYWSLVYTPNGTYMGETQAYSWNEREGNNLQFAEKVQDAWFLLWEDYDGRDDLLNTQ